MKKILVLATFMNIASQQISCMEEPAQTVKQKKITELISYIIDEGSLRAILHYSFPGNMTSEQEAVYHQMVKLVIKDFKSEKYNTIVSSCLNESFTEEEIEDLLASYKLKLFKALRQKLLSKELGQISINFIRQRQTSAAEEKELNELTTKFHELEVQKTSESK